MRMLLAVALLSAPAVAWGQEALNWRTIGDLCSTDEAGCTYLIVGMAESVMFLENGTSICPRRGDDVSQDALGRLVTDFVATQSETDLERDTPPLTVLRALQSAFPCS